MEKSWQAIDRFFPEAKSLRGEFDQIFRDPKTADPKRFSWDYWHVPEQYTHLRTPAYHFFSAQLYRRFHEYLVLWGRDNLGCHDISPPWLSCYIEGCRQDFHVDLPHGPWAFVFSLTPWQARQFTGGETFLLQDHVLNHWGSTLGEQGREREGILQLIEPKFNRLTIFDPRVPHGVREVRGVQDPCLGRLVVHGWFVNPRPFIQGPITERELGEKIEAWTAAIGEFLEEAGEGVQGLLSLRIQVDKSGQVRESKILSNLLRDPVSGRVAEALAKFLRKEIASTTFRKNRKESRITIPFCFDSAS